MNEYLQIVLRALFAIFFLLILCRINGPKQISQMSFYDYIVGISAGSIAATLSVDLDINWLFCVISIALFMLSSLLFSFLTSKSIFFRRTLSGNPIFLIAQGKINYLGLKRSHFDIDDMMRELRIQGYFDVSAINYAILENNGHVSILPKSADRPATAGEAGLAPPEGGVYANVIIDGKVMKGNLSAFNRDENWLNKELVRQGAKQENIVLGTLSPGGELSLFYKEGKSTPKTIFQ